jgi:hypothetical protein
MEGGREHRVPLSPTALAILRQMQTDVPHPEAIVFPSANGKPLSDMALTMTLRRMKRDSITVHGFRSTFRDCTADATEHSDKVAEMALAHAVGDQAEAAYRRGDLFGKARRSDQRLGAVHLGGRHRRGRLVADRHHGDGVTRSVTGKVPVTRPVAALDAPTKLYPDGGRAIRQLRVQRRLARSALSWGA